MAYVFMSFFFWRKKIISIFFLLFRLVGGYLTLSPELGMVVEDENGIVGYALAALNVNSYNQKMAVSWIPELRMKYPLDNSISELPQNIQVYEYQ